MTDAQGEIAAGRRFGFGRNWSDFLDGLTPERIQRAEAALADMLGSTSLAGKSLLDIGSGSGLSSLAARRLGASVTAFDYDPDSVDAANRLKARERPSDDGWTIAVGSVLDEAAMARLPAFDIVYSWGVLHHTGALWRALDIAAGKVRPGGTLFVALYNDQGWISRYWSAVKRLYNTGPFWRLATIAVHAPYLFGARYVLRLLTGRLHLERGMSMWHDMLDWLGGYPFEVATPASVTAFCRARGFDPARVVTCGGRHGCNEFVLVRRS